MTAEIPANLKAVPTEYKGIVFRSKSEAIFCRAMELRGYPIWEYEPKRWQTKDGWTPDFWFIGRNQKPKYKIASILVEYKPGDVTDTYLDKTLQRLQELGDKTHGHAFVVACGSTWNETRKVWHFTGESWSPEEKAYRLFLKLEEASRFRFDLKNAA